MKELLGLIKNIKIDFRVQISKTKSICKKLLLQAKNFLDLRIILWKMERVLTKFCELIWSNMYYESLQNHVVIQQRVFNRLKGATKLHFTNYSCVVSFFQYRFVLVCIFYLLFWETSFSSFHVWCVFWNLNSMPYYRIVRFRIIAFMESLFLCWPSGHLWFYSPFILFSLYKHNKSI